MTYNSKLCCYSEPSRTENIKGRQIKIKISHELTPVMNTSINFEPLTMKEFNDAVEHLQPGNAAGLDRIIANMILHFGET